MINNIKYMLRYIVLYGKQLILFGVISLILDCISAYVGLNSSKWIFDGCTEVSIGTMQVRIVLILLFMVAYSIYNICVNTNVLPFIQITLAEKISLDIMERVQKIPQGKIEGSQYYDRYSRAVRDADGRAEGVFHTILGFVSALLQGMITIVVLVQIEIPMAVVIFISSIITTVFSQRLNMLDYRQYIEQTSYRRKCEYVGRIFYLPQFSIDLKRYSSLVHMMKKYYSENMNQIKDNKKKYLKRINMLLFISVIVQTMAVSAYPWFVVISRLYRHSITVGNALLLFSAVSILPSVFEGILSSFVEMNRHSMHIDNFREILDMEEASEEEEGITDERFTIELCNVSFAYPGQKNYILKNVNFRLEQGEKIGLYGENGSGKTTLINLMSRVYDTYFGAITINAVELRKFGNEMINNMFCVVAQNYNIYSFSIIENVLLRAPKNEAEYEKVADVLKLVGLYEKVMSFPRKMDTCITKEFDEAGVMLSGGELQKLSFARAILSKAKCIILDEPTSALDSRSEQQICRLIQKLFQDRLVIVISHRPSMLRSMDKVVCLRNHTVERIVTSEQMCNEHISDEVFLGNFERRLLSEG